MIQPLGSVWTASGRQRPKGRTDPIRTFRAIARLVSRGLQSVGLADSALRSAPRRETSEAPYLVGYADIDGAAWDGCHGLRPQPVPQAWLVDDLRHPKLAMPATSGRSAKSARYPRSPGRGRGNGSPFGPL